MRYFKNPQIIFKMFMKKIVSFFTLWGVFIYSFGLSAQTKKACELTNVAEINAILGTTLQFDSNSNINKRGDFECRYTANNSNKYVAIGLVAMKIQYGYDAFKVQYEENEKKIASGGKAIGKFNRLVPYPKAGANSYYMTGPNDDFSSEAFIFYFRKGDYIISFSTNDISSDVLIKKIDDIFKTVGAKL
jgi:hypothetical protein